MNPLTIVAAAFHAMREQRLPYIVVIGIGEHQRDELLELVRDGEADGALVVSVDEDGHAESVETWAGDDITGARIAGVLKRALDGAGLSSVFTRPGVAS